MPSAKPDHATLDVSWMFNRFLAKEQIAYHYKTGGWIQQRENKPPRMLTWEGLDHLLVNNAVKKLARSRDRRQAAMYLHAMYEQESYRESVAQEIETWPSDNGHTLDTWIRAVCSEGQYLSTAVVKHWVWCVRRRLLGLPIHDHICPIMYGTTGSGKSVEARKLLAPLDQLVSEQSLDQICDERHAVELSRHFVIYVDEMAGADKAELTKLKSLITQETINSRIMYTQRRQLTPMHASFLGSSNASVTEVIRDTTSARRYWEIRTKDRLDWDTLNDLDRRLIWTAVEPQKASPLDAKTKEEVHLLQHAKLRLRPAQELWWDELELGPGEVPVPMADVWKSYREYCAEGGYFSGNRDRLSRWLSSQGCESIRHKSKRCRGFNEASQRILQASS